MKKMLLIVGLLALSTQAHASKSSLVLTCDFSTSANYQVVVDYPKGCASDVSKAISKLKAQHRYLDESLLKLSKPPKCPEGYEEFPVFQATRTSSGHASHTNSYQIRRICISK